MLEQSFDHNKRLSDLLHRREKEQCLRRLPRSSKLIDFCSNDYLGFTRKREICEQVQRLWSEGHYRLGAGAARLLGGNSGLAEKLESKIADFHTAEAALLFSSGYTANVGLLSSLPRHGDTILYDELSHASLRDGVRLSLASGHSFAHNNLQSLREKLARAKGGIFVVVESVYSMEGDLAPLKDLTSICGEHGAALIVDEAHASGVFGSRGEGLCAAEGLCSKVFARVLTFGKALGVHGAAVLGSAVLKEYLINFCRSFIYTTAQPDHALLAVQCAYEALGRAEDQRTLLHQWISLFRKECRPLGAALLRSHSPIQSIVIPGNGAVRNVCTALREQGFDIFPVLAPTVPAGSERLRIVLHSFNSEEELRSLCSALLQLHRDGGIGGANLLAATH